MTIKEIAKLAGVSSAAVSRYLNGGYVSEENCFWNIQMVDSGCVLQTIERLAFLPEETAGM